jgi:transcriptional regulator with XRE-family HTH domain
VKYGKKIELNRRKIGMTQYELAEKLGVSQPTVGYWERCERMPRMEHMARIAKLFNVNVSVLFFDDSERFD